MESKNPKAEKTRNGRIILSSKCGLLDGLLRVKSLSEGIPRLRNII